MDEYLTRVSRESRGKAGKERAETERLQEDADRKKRYEFVHQSRAFVFCFVLFSLFFFNTFSGGIDKTKLTLPRFIKWGLYNVHTQNQRGTQQSIYSYMLVQYELQWCIHVHIWRTTYIISVLFFVYIYHTYLYISFFFVLSLHGCCRLARFRSSWLSSFSLGFVSSCP